MGDTKKLDGGAFFASPIATLAANGTSNASSPLPVKNDRTITVQGLFTGVAGAKANVEFQLFGKVNGSAKYDTRPFWSLTIAADGTNEVVQSGTAPVADFEFVALKVVNRDSANAVTGVNAYWGAKRINREA